jgi:hypothetical protein
MVFHKVKIPLIRPFGTLSPAEPEGPIGEGNHADIGAVTPHSLLGRYTTKSNSTGYDIICNLGFEAQWNEKRS